jgi:hypothetical protein
LDLSLKSGYDIMEANTELQIGGNTVWSLTRCVACYMEANALAYKKGTVRVIRQEITTNYLPAIHDWFLFSCRISLSHNTRLGVID